VSTPELPVTLADVTAARERIAGVAVTTPVIPAMGLPGTGRWWLKLEGIQPTGSFKVRGAASRLGAIDPAILDRGVVTASTGNHGRAVAHVAAARRIPATICVSVHVPPGKVAALREIGCEVIIGGDSQADALLTADALVEERGMTLIHPFDDPQVIAGQGTIGLEMLEQVPTATTVVVPLSGGGLAAGIAVAVKATRPDLRVVGVAMERAAVMAASLDAGRPLDLPEEPTLADSLQGGIGLANATTFPIVRALVDEVVLLTEQEIWDGMRFAFDQHRLILEGGAAVGIAAVLAGHLDIAADEDGVLICSGANAEPAHVLALAQGQTTPPP
jgi:threonine dehydratase